MDNDSKISREKRERLYLEAHRHCIYCGRHIPDIKDMTVDHILPKAMGGTDAYDNLVCACSDCNGKKGEQFVFEFSNPRDQKRLGHYLNRIDQMYLEGQLSYEKHQLLKGVTEHPKQRIFNLRFRFRQLHVEISTHWAPLLENH